MKKLNRDLKTNTMRTQNKPATSKLVRRFDNELKDLLINDLKSFMEKNPFVMRNKQAMMQHGLSVA
jgi:hypothetical protein